MSYLTFNKLNNMQQSIQKSLNENYQFSTSNTVFLSHRHDDKQEVNQAVGFLAQFGQRTYIDWLDHSMPSQTSSETADKLKKRINRSNKFVLLATPGSIRSIWIPWELGLADGVKGLNKIAILPLVKNEGTWDEREYYGIYNYIEQSYDGDWYVIKQGESRRVHLANWFES